PPGPPSGRSCLPAGRAGPSVDRALGVTLLPRSEQAPRSTLLPRSEQAPRSTLLPRSEQAPRSTLLPRSEQAPRSTFSPSPDRFHADPPAAYPEFRGGEARRSRGVGRRALPPEFQDGARRPTARPGSGPGPTLAPCPSMLDPRGALTPGPASRNNP